MTEISLESLAEDGLDIADEDEFGRRRAPQLVTDTDEEGEPEQ